MKEIKVEWTGSYPALCMGRWRFFYCGKDLSNKIPFQGRPAYTYGKFTSWHFEDWIEQFELEESGEKFPEWIKTNHWLRKLVDEEDLERVYEAFAECDWRLGSCGGCI